MGRTGFTCLSLPLGPPCGFALSAMQICCRRGKSFDFAARAALALAQAGLCAARPVDENSENANTEAAASSAVENRSELMVTPDTPNGADCSLMILGTRRTFYRYHIHIS
jgi:hypothetical protein